MTYISYVVNYRIFVVKAENLTVKMSLNDRIFVVKGFCKPLWQ